MATIVVLLEDYALALKVEQAFPTTDDWEYLLNITVLSYSTADFLVALPYVAILKLFVNFFSICVKDEW